MAAKKHKEHKRGDETRWSEGGGKWGSGLERLPGVVKWEDGVRIDPSESK
jgi:hypothetical protein